MKLGFGTYPWAFETPGGGERQLMAYKHHLSNLSIDVKLMNMWNPEFHKFDIFHFFSVMPGSVQLCEYVKSRGARLVISPNLWVTPETQYDYPHADIAYLLKFADAIVVNSEMEKQSLSLVYNIPQENFFVVYNGVEETFLQREDPSGFIDSYNINNRYILNIANIEERKNQLNLMHALSYFDDIDLVVIGNVRDKQYLEMCKKIGGNRFKYVGELPYGSKMIKSAIAGCTFFAMPSTLETPSIAALEALASGANLMITNGGSTTEYFDRNVAFVDPYDIQSIVSGIESSLKKTGSEPFNDKYLWKNIANDLVDVYQKLI